MPKEYAIKLWIITGSLKERFSLAWYVCPLMEEVGGGGKMGFGQKMTLQIFNRVEMGFVTTKKS